MPRLDVGDIVADLHCHTVASVHAYSTVRDNINKAGSIGLQAIAFTDHGIGVADSPPLSFFDNLISLPDYIDGIRVLKGVEANIMDHDGNIDMPKKLLAKLDVVIASYHTSAVEPGDIQQHTNSYLMLAKNPYVHIIGHSGSHEYQYDYERVIPVFKENNKLVEINSHTFICRKKSIENCKTIAMLCAKHRVPIVVNSDAHSEFELGDIAAAVNMLNDIHFPKELILNTNLANTMNFFKKNL